MHCDTVLVNNSELLYTKSTEPKIDNLEKKLENYLKSTNTTAPAFEEEFQKNYDQLKCLVGGQGTHLTVYTFPIDLQEWASQKPDRKNPIVFVTFSELRQQKSRAANSVGNSH